MDGIMEPPLVSVIIPTYYRNDLLRKAVRSVREQTHNQVEVIVVDDSGERHAEPALEPFENLQYVPLPENRGPNRAREAGIERASGEYVQFFDDDDRMFETKLEKQLAAFQRANSAVGVVYSGVEMSDGRTELPDSEARGDVLSCALAFELWPCMTSTMLIEREIVELLRPFPDRPAGTDLEQMIQLADRTEFEFVAEPLVNKRIDVDSTGFSDEALQARFDIVEEYAALYDARPDRVRRKALANAHETIGRTLLQRHLWSARATAAFATSFWYRPDIGFRPFAQVLASLFGRPGWNAARTVNQRL
jgi:glycosyltransferase involved in cell wall biosynthesis